MRSALEAGFIFWGLFGVFGLILALYLAWMWWVERNPSASDPGRAGGGDAGAGAHGAEVQGKAAP